MVRAPRRNDLVQRQAARVLTLASSEKRERRLLPTCMESVSAIRHPELVASSPARAQQRWTIAVLALLVLVYVLPLVRAATEAEFWRGLAPVATLVIWGVVAALVLRRRWAWRLLVVFQVSIVFSCVIDFPGWLAFALNALALLLLLTPQLREYTRVRRRTAFGTEPALRGATPSR